MPILSAKQVKPPEFSMADFKAALLSLMGEHSSIACAGNQVLLHCADKAMLYAIGMTIGKRLRAARKKIGLTQKALGAVVGVTDAAISDFERDGSSPDIHRIPAIASALKVPIKWLLAGGDEPPPEEGIDTIWERLTPGQKRQLLRFLKAMAEEGSGEAA